MSTEAYKIADRFISEISDGWGEDVEQKDKIRLAQLIDEVYGTIHEDYKASRELMDEMDASLQYLWGERDELWSKNRELQDELEQRKRHADCLKEDLKHAADLLDKATACEGIGPDAALKWWSSIGKLRRKVADMENKNV
jgi:chromosome segregation ATPase